MCSVTPGKGRGVQYMDGNLRIVGKSVECLVEFMMVGRAMAPDGSSKMQMKFTQRHSSS